MIRIFQPILDRASYFLSLKKRKLCNIKAACVMSVDMLRFSNDYYCNLVIRLF